MPDITDRAQLSSSVQDRNLLGMGIAVVGWLTLACMDAGSKIQTASYPVVQILWFRYVLFVIVAFIGMLVILRPGLDVLQPVTLLVLVAALIGAIYLVLTRLAGRIDAPEVSLFWLAITGFAILCAFVPFFWKVPVTMADWGLLLLVAILGIIGHFCLIKAFQMAEASILQPYIYSGLIGAIVVGYVVFGDLPDLPTFAGALIIVGSGLYVFARERGPRS